MIIRYYVFLKFDYHWESIYLHVYTCLLRFPELIVITLKLEGVLKSDFNLQFVHYYVDCANISKTKK